MASLDHPERSRNILARLHRNYTGVRGRLPGSIIHPMPGPSETLVSLKQRLAQRMLDFELLDEAWPSPRAGTGWHALSEIVVEWNAESASNFAIEKPHPTETPMDWDKIALALAGVMFVTIFPGATVVVNYDNDGAVSSILPATHVPDEILADKVEYRQHPGWSFEIQVLSNDSPPTVTKLIFGPVA